MDRQIVADRVGMEIYTTEEALDDAYGRVTRLVNALIEARRDARLSTTVGHDVFESLNEVCGAMTNARGALVMAHKRLDIMRRALRLEQTVAEGPIDKAPHLMSNAEPIRLADDRRAA
jgi:hypothetical protein